MASFSEYTINAKDNFWGHESGPYHPSKNPTGKGDNVSDFVDFLPWLDENGEPIEENKNTQKGKNHFALYGLLSLILLTLVVLVVVMRLPDEYFKRRHPSMAIGTEQTPPQPPQRLNTCPHCGGSFEVATQKRPIRFVCHFCGKEIEFE